MKQSFKPTQNHSKKENLEITLYEMFIYDCFIAGKKADQEVKVVQLKKLIEFFIVSEVRKIVREELPVSNI